MPTHTVLLADDHTIVTEGLSRLLEEHGFDVVGTVGASGVDGPGLYFEMRSQGKPQDPQEWLAREGTRSEPATMRSER